MPGAEPSARRYAAREISWGPPTSVLSALVFIVGARVFLLQREPTHTKRGTSTRASTRQLSSPHLYVRASLFPARAHHDIYLIRAARRSVAQDHIGAWGAHRRRSKRGQSRASRPREAPAPCTCMPRLRTPLPSLLTSPHLTTTPPHRFGCALAGRAAGGGSPLARTQASLFDFWERRASLGVGWTARSKAEADRDEAERTAKTHDEVEGVWKRHKRSNRPSPHPTAIFAWCAREASVGMLCARNERSMRVVSRLHRGFIPRIPLLGCSAHRPKPKNRCRHFKALKRVPHPAATSSHHVSPSTVHPILHLRSR